MDHLIYLNSEYKGIKNYPKSNLERKSFFFKKFLKLQEWLLENNKKMAIVFEGRDAAGKVQP